jgi:predicted transcriptional regulator of viral defense system
MEWEHALAEVSAVAARQLGLVSMAQAERIGIDRATLDDLGTAGLLTLLDWEVYEVAGSAIGPRYGYPYAAWLALSPAAFAWERPRGNGDAVISHESACRLLGLGSPSVQGITFTAPTLLPEPRSTRLVVQTLRPDEVTAVEGVPVTTAHRTVLDLTADHTDHTELRRVITDAVASDLVDLSDLYKDLAPLAAQHHFPAAGSEFARYFLSQLDVPALSVRNLRAFATLVVPDQVEKTAAALAAALPGVDESVLRDVAAEFAGKVGPA